MHLLRLLKKEALLNQEHIVARYWNTLSLDKKNPFKSLLHQELSSTNKVIDKKCQNVLCKVCY